MTRTKARPVNRRAVEAIGEGRIRMKVLLEEERRKRRTWLEGETSGTARMRVHQGNPLRGKAGKDMIRTKVHLEGGDPKRRKTQEKCEEMTIPMRVLHENRIQGIVRTRTKVHLEGENRKRRKCRERREHKIHGKVREKITTRM